MPAPRFTVGIDLGTTNSAVAYVDTSAEFASGDPIKTFLVRQLVAPGVVEGKTLLPSSMYFPAGSEVPEGSTGLPWDPGREHVVGYLARALGARVPSRLVHSAKSWLCHPDVDRRGPILPWAATDDVPHLSPVQASAEYLDHIREAWNAQAGRTREDRLEEQEIYLTVPASFDAVARQLTMEAAREAGLANVTLLEEPQAAFYCWIGTNAQDWRQGLGPGRVLLVCDIGGGTTDFTLIVLDEAGAKQPRPERVAVGDHLLLGGDNMDLALAHVLEPRLVGKKKLAPWEWGALTHACREAKEELLKKAKVESVPVSVLGQSSRVVGGTLSTKLTREELTETIVDGFFPACGRDDAPAADRAGLTELGLPYTADPGVTRHLAKFLRDAAPAVAERLGASSASVAGGMARPDIVLFNGGVFRSNVLQKRLVEVLAGWFAGEPGYKPRALVNASPDLAVARGAAYYGLVRRGHGVRIAGGAARAYYLGLGDAGLGQVARVMCVLPRGAEEGELHALAGRRFQLTLGQAVRFPLYASSIRLKDGLGELLDRTARGLVALPALRTVVEAEEGHASAEVQLTSRLTETGTLELFCEEPGGAGRRWQLELELRGAATEEASETAGTGQRSAEALAQAQALVRAVYSPQARAASGLPKDPNGLRRRLEEALSARRELWIPRTLRTLASTALEVADGRGAGPVHEARWLNMVGFGVRPGFGYPDDRARVDRLWKLFAGGLKHPREEEGHREWWILWRRAAAGLAPDRQEQIFTAVAAHLLPEAAKRRGVPPEAVKPGVLQEMWRVAAVLEWIAPAEKVRLGEVLLGMVSASKAPPFAFWALARIGARHPVGGAIAHVVPAATAAQWIGRLVKLLRAHGETVSFALAHIARRTGDRARDLDESARKALLKQMQDLGAPERHRQLVGEVVKLADAERGAMMGDSIPPGLELLGE